VQTRPEAESLVTGAGAVQGCCRRPELQLEEVRYGGSQDGVGELPAVTGGADLGLDLEAGEATAGAVGGRG
jgi:hypothetical protein